jgi:hypothetical protein
MAEGNYLVGVDIGSSSIKLCQLKDIRGKRTLVKFGYYALPPQTIVDGHVQNAPAIVEGLNQLYNQLKIKRREVALAVSGHAVIIKKMALPLMTSAELDEQIDWEAEQQIPYDIKDVQIDYDVLRKRPEQGQMDVLLVAAKKEDVNDAAQIARDAALRLAWGRALDVPVAATEGEWANLLFERAKNLGAGVMAVGNDTEVIAQRAKVARGGSPARAVLAGASLHLINPSEPMRAQMASLHAVFIHDEAPRTSAFERVRALEPLVAAPADREHLARNVLLCRDHHGRDTYRDHRPAHQTTWTFSVTPHGHSLSGVARDDRGRAMV